MIAVGIIAAMVGLMFLVPWLNRHERARKDEEFRLWCIECDRKEEEKRVAIQRELAVMIAEEMRRKDV